MKTPIPVCVGVCTYHLQVCIEHVRTGFQQVKPGMKTNSSSNTDTHTLDWFAFACRKSNYIYSITVLLPNFNVMTTSSLLFNIFFLVVVALFSSSL